MQDILQQKLGSRRMAGRCLCSGAKCRPRVRQARSAPGAGENGRRPRHPGNEVCVTAARCSLPGAGARETLAELVGLLQPLILAVSPLKQWKAAPPHLGLPSLSLPASSAFLLSSLVPFRPGGRSVYSTRASESETFSLAPPRAQSLVPHGL